MSAMHTHTIPAEIEQAFYRIYRGGTDDQTFETFASRWGGLDLATFQRVIEIGEGNDKFVAMYVMGYSPSPRAGEILVPFLHSMQRKERWVSALCLGMRQDARGFPVLRDLLLDGLSLEEQRWGEEHPETEQAREIFWIRDHRSQAIALLEDWDDSSLIPVLKFVFRTIWDREQALQHSINEEAALDELAYVLGHRGDFSVLDGRDLPPDYTQTAMVFLILGSLNARSTLGNPTHISALLRYADVAPQVVEGLRQHFAITAQEAQDYVNALYENKLSRYDYGKVKDTSLDGNTNKDRGERAQEEEDEEDEDELAPEIAFDPPLLCTYQAHREPVHDLAWSPDGLRLVSASADGSAKVWDAATGQLLTTFLDHHASVNAVSWSPDGLFIASAGNDSCVSVWYAETGVALSTYQGHSAYCQDIAWSPDGTSLASASWDHTVQVWEPLSGKLLQTYRGHEGVVCTLTWSPDGKQIASGGGAPECAVHVWDVTTGNRTLVYLKHSRSATKETYQASSVHSLTWSPDKTRIASYSGSHYAICRVWDATTGKDLLIRDEYCQGMLAWSPDGALLICPGLYSETVDQWDATTNKTQVNYAPSTLINNISALQWSPEGKRIAAVDERGNVSVWNGIKPTL